MPALTATPSALKNAKPCLNCLSEKRLKAIMVYAMRTSAGLTLAQVNTRSACYRGLSRKDKLVALTAMIANQLVPSLTANQLATVVPCKTCGSDSQLEADLLFLFANYFQSTAL